MTPALADAALRRYQVGAYRLSPLAESFNTVLRVDSAGGRFVLRIGPAVRIHAVNAASAEDRWTRDLERQGLPVPRVVRSVDGRPSVTVADAEGHAHECTLLTWVPGRSLTHPAPAADVADLARLSARLHAASGPGGARPDGTLDAATVLLLPLPDRLDAAPVHRHVFTAARDRAQQAVDAVWARAHEAPRLLHGDLTPANVVRAVDGLCAIDFQDLMWGHVEQDLAHSIYGVTRGEGLAAGLRAFRSAYEQVRPWPDLDADLLADLVAGRRVAMVNLALHRGRPDLPEYLERHAAALLA